MCHWTPSWQPTALISLERFQQGHGGAVWEAEDQARIILPVNHVYGGFGKGNKNKHSKTWRHPWKSPEEYFKACWRSQLLPTPPGFTFLAVAAAGSLVEGQKKDWSVHPSLLRAPSTESSTGRLLWKFVGRVREKMCSHSQRCHIEISFIIVSLVPPDSLVFNVSMRVLDHCYTVSDAQMESWDDEYIKANHQAAQIKLTKKQIW